MSRTTPSHVPTRRQHAAPGRSRRTQQRPGGDRMSRNDNAPFRAWTRRKCAPSAAARTALPSAPAVSR